MFSAIVPCRDEREALPIFYDEFIKVMDSAGASNFEIIFVEDGSKDGTLEFLRELAARDKRVKYISLSRNFGKEAAMYAGLREAKGDIAAIMDADLQDPPSLLPKMFEIMREDCCDSVATRRKNRTGESAVRSFCARAFYRILNSLSPLKFVEGARDFRLINRRVIDAILEMPEYNRFIKGMYEWVGYGACDVFARRSYFILHDTACYCGGNRNILLPIFKCCHCSTIHKAVDISQLGVWMDVYDLCYFLP